MSRIYLDHAATSPLRPEARAAMEEGFAIWANPSSPHAEGRKAKAALEDARERCKRALGWDGELIFTSGASESADIAINHSKARKVAVSTVEHDAVANASSDATSLTMREDGALDLEGLVDEEFTRGTLIALQHVNSELGVLQDMHHVRKRISKFNGVLLADCAQSAGKLVLPDCDMAIVSAHKFGGPIGTGALLLRDLNLLEARGGHERGYRRGTENLPAALGMAAALEENHWQTSKAERERFLQKLGMSVCMWGTQVDYIIPLTHPTMSAQALLIRLDAIGFAVSAGSACSSGTLKKSRVLDAFGVDDDTASRTIRVSLGWSTTPEELDAFVEAWASLT